MARLNYGLALGSNGDYQIALTTAEPGVRDDYSPHLSTPFTFFVAPAEYVDGAICLNWLEGDAYREGQERAIKEYAYAIKNSILSYHQRSISNRKTHTPTYDFGLGPEITEWEEVVVPKRYGSALPNRSPLYPVEAD
jgi:hypothetical protein